MTKSQNNPLKKNDDDSPVLLEIEGLTDGEWYRFGKEFEDEYNRVVLERLPLVKENLPEGMENYKKTQDEITSMVCRSLGLPPRLFKPEPTSQSYRLYDPKKGETDGNDTDRQ